MNSEEGADIVRRISLAREASRLTQKDAAEGIGVSRQKVGRWEKGASWPTLPEFRRMCIVYGVTPAQVLLGGNVQSAINRALSVASGADAGPQ